MGPQLIDQTAVEIEPAAVCSARPVGLNPGPSDGEAVRADPEVAHQGYVLLVAVVVVTSHVPGVTVQHLARRVAERVPNGQAAPVLMDRPFHLVRGGPSPPQEAIRKVQQLRVRCYHGDGVSAQRTIALMDSDGL